MPMNLKDETLEGIEESGHTLEDIVFIGSERSGHRCTVEEFLVLADRNYDDGGFGAVAIDLVIVFSDGAIMRRCTEERYGEWWGHESPFREPEASLAIRTLFYADAPPDCRGYDLASINAEAARNE